ncbi:LOW QUALITY PROTEIN: hypothetical protein CRUP_025062 [Coryphaenoides rupestris]|nr:LOW QUALITY PROTEIN: hypothetical protein CRUP_025062 [Coryphaenoides rupestris]
MQYLPKYLPKPRSNRHGPSSLKTMPSHPCIPGGQNIPKANLRHHGPNRPISTTARLATAPSPSTTTTTATTFEYMSKQSVHTHVPGPTVNTRVTQASPKPWQTPQNGAPPSPPQRSNSYTVHQKSSSPINPMATVLIPTGSSYEMPAVRGKGADLFAKRQSRMERFIVDSETVQHNKESRSASPAASLPTEWKYSPNALGRNYSLSPPASRVSSLGRRQTSASLSPRPQVWAPAAAAPPVAKQSTWLERSLKPPTPWEAASRHPLGLVDEAFSHQSLHQAIASNVRLAVQRKMLPEPPDDWKARVSYQPTPRPPAAAAASPRTGVFQSQSWSHARSRSHARPPLPSFASPPPSAQSGVSAPGRYYGSLPRQWQPQQQRRSTAEAHPRSPAMPSSEYRRPLATPTFKAAYTSSTTWSCKR